MTLDKNKPPAGLRNLAHVAAGLVIWLVTMLIATRALHTHPSSVALRIALVIVGVGGFLPWLLSVGRLIMAQDEFSLRVHLVAIALTCATTAVLLLTGDYLQTSGFVGYVPLQHLWMAMGVLWWLWIMIASWYYR
jgi:hypothetical protein